MAPAPLCECGRHKLTRMQEVVAEDVLRFTLGHGTRTRRMRINLQEYFDDLPQVSTANYRWLSEREKKTVFTKDEQDKISADPAWETFDADLLYKGIRLGCENVAALDDPAWSPDSDSLEGMLTKIKHERSRIFSDRHQYTTTELRAKVGERRNLYMRTLEAAKTRWSIPDQLVVDEKQKVEERIEFILECLPEEDGLPQHSSRRVQEVENSLCKIAEHILRFILKHGKKAPDPPYPPNSLKPFQDYLDNLPQHSTAHYCHLSKKSKKKAFTKEEQIKLIDNPSLSRFDVPLLYKVIRLGCENVASLDDPVWTEDNDTLEGLLTKLKNQRNLFIHDRHELKFSLNDKVNELKNLFMKLLEAAQVRYGIPAQEVIDEKRRVEEGIQRVLINPN